MTRTKVGRVNNSLCRLMQYKFPANIRCAGTFRTTEKLYGAYQFQQKSMSTMMTENNAKSRQRSLRLLPPSSNRKISSGWAWRKMKTPTRPPSPRPPTVTTTATTTEMSTASPVRPLLGPRARKTCHRNRIIHNLPTPH